MKLKRNHIVIIIGIIAVFMIIGKPYLLPSKELDLQTSNPYEAYQDALHRGKPIFLEFYASW